MPAEPGFQELRRMIDSSVEQPVDARYKLQRVILAWRWGPRTRRVSTTVLAVLLTAYASALLILNLLTVGLLQGPPEAVPLGDLGSFYASGQAAAHGLDPYDVYPLTLDAVRGRGNGAAINLNAPISVPLFELMTAVDAVSARGWWLIASLGAYAAMLALLLRTTPGFRGPLQIAWALALTPLFETLLLGQVYALLSLLATIAWLLIGKHPKIAGGLIGFLVAFKPNFVVWPILLALGRQRAAAVASLASAAFFGVLPIALYGPRVYVQWLDGIRLEQVNPQVANASVPGMLVRLGASQLLAAVAAGLLLIGLGAYVWRRRPSAAHTSDVAVVGSLLASPLGWVGYSLFMLPLFARMRATPPIVVAAGVLCIPRLLLQGWTDSSPLLKATLGSVFTLAWIVVLAYAIAGVKTADLAADTH